MKVLSLKFAAAVFCAGMLSVTTASARADDGPPAGTYNIRLYTKTRVGDESALVNYTITSYIVLRADGTYEIYESATKALRSRGIYTYEPGKEGQPGSKGRVRWKSGLNHQMGRGGSYFAPHPGYRCAHCLVIGNQAVAVLER